MFEFLLERVGYICSSKGLLYKILTISRNGACVMNEVDTRATYLVEIYHSCCDLS